MLSSCVPKLIGSYEEEVHLIIEEIIRRRYSIVVNIGCAEGYYAVGFALRIPDAIVYAFDIETTAQQGMMIPFPIPVCVRHPFYCARSYPLGFGKER